MKKYQKFKDKIIDLDTGKQVYEMKKKIHQKGDIIEVEIETPEPSAIEIIDEEELIKIKLEDIE